MAKLQFGEEIEQDKVVPDCPDGVLVHGLFMDGFRWDNEKMVVEDSLPGQMFGTLPMIHMVPKMDFEATPDKYRAPLYKTSLRAGVLSTTGRESFRFHSNFQ